MSKIIVFRFIGNKLRLSLLILLNKLQLLVAIIVLDYSATFSGWWRHIFRDKSSLFQSEYVGINFGAAVPRKLVLENLRDSGVEGEYFNLRYSVFRCSPGVNIPLS